MIDYYNFLRKIGHSRIRSLTTSSAYSAANKVAMLLSLDIDQPPEIRAEKELCTLEQITNGTYKSGLRRPIEEIVFDTPPKSIAEACLMSLHPTYLRYKI